MWLMNLRCNVYLSYAYSTSLSTNVTYVSLIYEKKRRWERNNFRGQIIKTLRGIVNNFFFGCGEISNELIKSIVYK